MDMKELYIRSLSGLIFGIVVVACIFLTPWTMAALLLFVVSVGTFEMCRLHGITDTLLFSFVEIFVCGSFAIGGLAALGTLPQRWLLLELLLMSSPFLLALFSKHLRHESIFACCYAAFFFLSLPSTMMLFMYRHDLFGTMAGPWLVLLVFVLLWANDIFAYLTGRLLGKHKLFERISPGKTIEGSIGGLVFTIITIIVFSRYADWLPLRTAVGMGTLAVVFGTLGDLCESMLKRQAGVKDSGTLIPGHGGILDRFDSVMFSVPFIFVYLLLL